MTDLDQVARKIANDNIYFARRAVDDGIYPDIYFALFDKIRERIFDDPVAQRYSADQVLDAAYSAAEQIAGERGYTR